jgi:hypothetical protein
VAKPRATAAIEDTSKARLEVSYLPLAQLVPAPRNARKSQQYCDVTIRRWQAFSGGTGTLEGNGRAFADIETERGLSHAD